MTIGYRADKSVRLLILIPDPIAVDVGYMLFVSLIKNCYVATAPVHTYLLVRQWAVWYR